MTLQSLEQEVRGEIMKTDVFVKIFFPESQRPKGEAALQRAFEMFRLFEGKYSRFLEGNELWELNQSESCIVSPELFALLERAQEMFALSSGLFDPAVLPILEREGYRGAYETRGSDSLSHTFAEVQLDPVTRRVNKPRSLKIDLGGIGKGFIVDRVSEFLSREFDHFLIDAGGDICVRGRDQSQSLDGWAIAIEDPRNAEGNLATLVLHNQCIATSGVNRRRWKKETETRHHLIDPTSGTSSTSDLLSVTVIADDTLSADLFAKVLFLSGSTQALRLADERSLPAILVTQEHVTINSYAKPFVWSS